MERVSIIHAISDIIENECKPCDLTEGLAQTERTHYCQTNCDHGQELKQLGDQLNEKRREKVRMSVKPSYEAYKDMTAQGMQKGEIAVKFGVSTAKLAQLVKEWREKAGEVMPGQKRKPGRPKKEVKPAVNTKKPEDEFNKLAYELKSNNQRMKQLEDELAEKDKLIKLKTEDQAQLMKENGDLRKKSEAVSEMYDSTTEELRDIKQKLFETENQASLLEDELSAYKEKLAKVEEKNDALDALSKNLIRKLEEPVNDTNREQEVEIEELRHKIECLEKTLMCYMTNGRG